jgi:uncharacterized protein
MRILFLIDASPESMERVMKANPYIAQLCKNEWVQLATVTPDSGDMHIFTPTGFVPYLPGADELPKAPMSVDWYRGWRENLKCAEIDSDGKPETKATARIVPGDRQ